MTELATAGYEVRRNWSDKHMDQVRIALARKFFLAGSLEQDAKFGIDLCIPKLDISVRIRQLTYKKFHDFTFRTSGGGGEPEYQKLLKGNRPDYLFYAYALDKDTLAAGYLIDLSMWRLAVKTGEAVGQHVTNKDGSSFVAFPFLKSYAEQIL